MVYFWSDQESINDLNHKLLYTNFELNTAKMIAREEVGKNDEIIKQLLQHLNAACQERDEARSQLQKLVNELLPSMSADQNPLIFSSQDNNENPSPPKPSNPAMLKESDIAPQSYNFHVYGSYPTNCNLGNSISFQGLPNPNFAAADSSNFGFSKKPAFQECGSKLDYASAVIDKIASVKPLPKKGKLVEAVMKTGPLLQTLLVAPLPKWKNPPPLPLQNPIAPHLIYGSEEVAVDSLRATQSPSPGYGASIFLDNCSPGFSHIPSSSVLNFARGSACLNNGMEFHVGNNNVDAMQYQIPTGKRMRL